jgi:putative transposase
MKDHPFTPSPEALLRHQVVTEVENHVLSGEKAGAAIEEVLQLPHFNQDGSRRKLTKRTLYRWRKAFREGGLAGLEPQQRARIADSKVLSGKLVGYMKAQKQLDPNASIPEVIRRAEVAGVVSTVDEVSRTTVWRTCKRMGLPVKRSRGYVDRDQRRFAYPHRMMMVIGDGDQ